MILDRVGFSLSWDAIEIALDSIMRSVLRFARPVEGAPETVAALSAAGVQLGVVSSAVHHEFLLWSLERFGMLDPFDRVVTSASCGFYKSRPEIYWSALRGLDAAPEWALHVGDSLRFDVGGAARAGMRTAWYQRPNTKETPNLELNPDLIVSSLNGAATALLAVAQHP
jgi:putative hydrolase of the HAD superfamily